MIENNNYNSVQNMRTILLRRWKQEEQKIKLFFIFFWGKSLMSHFVVPRASLCLVYVGVCLQHYIITNNRTGIIKQFKRHLHYACFFV